MTKYVKGSAPTNLKDMTGHRSGMLSVIVRAESRDNKAYWLCRCDCGAEPKISGDVLRRGQYSCGCVALGRRTHGMSETRGYKIWGGMIQRCTNSEVAHFADYGGRGITVCARWAASFANFIADMGDPPPGHSIERRDNEAGYSPENCYWLPLKRQSQNRRGNIYVEVAGETVCVAEAARRLGISYGTARYRATKAVKKRELEAPVGRSILLTFNGETLNLKQWANRLGVVPATLSMRRKKGWPVERILGALP